MRKPNTLLVKIDHWLGARTIYGPFPVFFLKLQGYHKWLFLPYGFISDDGEYWSIVWARAARIRVIRIRRKLNPFQRR